MRPLPPVLSTRQSSEPRNTACSKQSSIFHLRVTASPKSHDRFASAHTGERSDILASAETLPSRRDNAWGFAQPLKQTQKVVHSNSSTSGEFRQTPRIEGDGETSQDQNSLRRCCFATVEYVLAHRRSCKAQEKKRKHLKSILPRALSRRPRIARSGPLSGARPVAELQRRLPCSCRGPGNGGFCCSRQLAERKTAP